MRLTRREKLIVLYVLISLIVGVGVKHWRELRREQELVSAADTAQVEESN